MNHTKYDREAQSLIVESKGNNLAVYSACAVFSMTVMFYVLDAVAMDICSLSKYWGLA